MELLSFAFLLFAELANSAVSPGRVHKKSPIVYIVGPKYDDRKIPSDKKADFSDANYYRCDQGRLKILDASFYCVVERQWPQVVPIAIINADNRFSKAIADTRKLVKAAVGADLIEAADPDVLIIFSTRQQITQADAEPKLMVSEKTDVDPHLLRNLQRSAARTYGCVGVPSHKGAATPSATLIDTLLGEPDRGCVQEAFWSYFGISMPTQTEITKTFGQVIDPPNDSVSCSPARQVGDGFAVLPLVAFDQRLLWRRNGQALLDEKFSYPGYQFVCWGGATF